MKDDTLVFLVVPEKDGSLAHNLDVVPLPENFGFPSVPELILRDDENLGIPREVLDMLKMDSVNVEFLPSK